MGSQLWLHAFAAFAALRIAIFLRAALAATERSYMLMINAV